MKLWFVIARMPLEYGKRTVMIHRHVTMAATSEEAIEITRTNNRGDDERAVWCAEEVEDAPTVMRDIYSISATDEDRAARTRRVEEASRRERERNARRGAP